MSLSVNKIIMTEDAKFDYVVCIAGFKRKIPQNLKPELEEYINQFQDLHYLSENTS